MNLIYPWWVAILIMVIGFIRAPILPAQRIQTSRQSKRRNGPTTLRTQLGDRFTIGSMICIPKRVLERGETKRAGANGWDRKGRDRFTDWPNGEKPKGQTSTVERPKGERPEGERPSGRFPIRERPKGEGPKGEGPRRTGRRKFVDRKIWNFRKLL